MRKNAGSKGERGHSESFIARLKENEMGGTHREEKLQIQSRSPGKKKSQ